MTFESAVPPPPPGSRYGYRFTLPHQVLSSADDPAGILIHEFTKAIRLLEKKGGNIDWVSFQMQSIVYKGLFLPSTSYALEVVTAVPTVDPQV